MLHYFSTLMFSRSLGLMLGEESRTQVSSVKCIQGTVQPLSQYPTLGCALFPSGKRDALPSLNSTCVPPLATTIHSPVHLAGLDSPRHRRQAGSRRVCPFVAAVLVTDVCPDVHLCPSSLGFMSHSCLHVSGLG